MSPWEVQNPSLRALRGSGKEDIAFSLEGLGEVIRGGQRTAGSDLEPVVEAQGAHQFPEGGCLHKGLF